MTRSGQNDEGIAPRQGAKNIVVEFSNSPQIQRWQEHTPSQGSETRTTDQPARVRAIVDAEQPAPLPKRIANRYDVEKLLGIGGQADVYLADDTTLQRPVAIKISKAGRELSETEQTQFKQEARSIAKLEHTGIVKVYDYGIHDDGRYFIVLQYLPGQSLKDCLRKEDAKQTFTIQRTVELIGRIADALHYAHQEGIYHRDLKPGNILLNKNGDPHITDFGLAVTHESQRGLKGEIAGTVPYMAPEQVRGESHWLNGQADIWAIGVILYEMLAGHRPFQGETEEEVNAEILRRPPTSLREQNPQIPKWLDELVLKCLAKDPTHRFATARDLAVALNEGLQAKVATNPAVAVPKRQVWSRPVYVYAALVAIAAVTVVGIGIRTNFWNSSGTPDANENSTAGAPSDPQPVAPKKVRSGEWQFHLDQKPVPILWPFPGESQDWTFFPTEKKVNLLTNKRHLLRTGDTRRENYDLSITIKQAPWLGGKMGLFFGCHEFAGAMPKTMQYETVTVEWNGQASDKPLSIDHTLHLEAADGPAYLRHVPNILDAKEIPPPGFQALTVVVSVRNRRLAKIVVFGDQKNVQPLVEFNPRQQPSVPTLQGLPALPIAEGEYGLFVDESHDGISGEFLAFGFRFHD